jgi:hypothetical protein
MKIAIAGDFFAISDELRRLFDISDSEILIARFSGESADILVFNEFSDDAAKADFSASAILLNTDEAIPGDIKVFSCSPRIVITYGLNSKACITASSFQDGFTNICVQRDFITVGGEVCERKELRLPTRNPIAALAAASIALVAGLKSR